MKILKKKKPSIYKDTAADDGAGEVASWMVTDPTEIRQIAEASKIMSGNRPPEFYMKDGEEKTIRLLSHNPISSFSRYRFKKDGKWQQATKPASDQDDLFAEQGLKSQLVFVWVVLDYEGYLDKKKNKQMTNLVRYWVVPPRLYSQLMMIGKKREPNKLTQYDLVVSRTGSSTDTAYMIMPESPEPLPSKIQDSIAEKVAELKRDVGKFYRPLDLKEQRALLRGV